MHICGLAKIFDFINNYIPNNNKVVIRLNDFTDYQNIVKNNYFEFKLIYRHGQFTK